LSSFLIQSIQQDSAFTSIYYICNSYTTGKNLLEEILRCFICQLLRANLDLAPYIFENYANKGKYAKKGFASAIVWLRRLIAELLDIIPSVQVILDGIDEYPESDQRAILMELLSLSMSCSGTCKILISSRISVQIKKVLSSQPTISLRDYNEEVQGDIRAYICEGLRGLRGRFSDQLIDTVETKVLERADGSIIIPIMHWTTIDLF
jgi:hypothetical protein